MRKKIENATVYRGGVTAEYLSRESQNVLIDYNDRSKTVKLSTSIRSKGGGDTRVVLEIDAFELLEYVSNAFRDQPVLPENMGENY